MTDDEIARAIRWSKRLQHEWQVPMEIRDLVPTLLDEIERLRAECHGRRFDPNLVEQVDSLRQQLAAVTTARDDACRLGLIALARLCRIEHEADWAADHARIGETWKVGR